MGPVPPVPGLDQDRDPKRKAETKDYSPPQDLAPEASGLTQPPGPCSVCEHFEPQVGEQHEEPSRASSGCRRSIVHRLRPQTPPVGRRRSPRAQGGPAAHRSGLASAPGTGRQRRRPRTWAAPGPRATHVSPFTPLIFPICRARPLPKVTPSAEETHGSANTDRARESREKKTERRGRNHWPLPPSPARLRVRVR